MIGNEQIEAVHGIAGHRHSRDSRIDRQGRDTLTTSEDIMPLFDDKLDAIADDELAVAGTLWLTHGCPN